MSKNSIAGLIGVMTLAGWTHGLLADTILVPNGSFELPATPYVSINIDSWQKSPKPDDYIESGGFLWTQLTGIFKNTGPGSSDHIDNCDGNQALWLFAVPDVALFQDYDSVDWHNQPTNHQFNTVFTIGRSYHLTVGVIGTGGGMLEGATLELSLYYRDSASNHVIVAFNSVTNTPAVFSNSTHFVDCRVDVPTVKPADPWAGQHLGIQLKSTVSTNLQGGYWDLDNVRLIEGPVLVNPFLDGNQFGFTLFGEVGAAFEILTTTNANFSSEDWGVTSTLTNTMGRTIFTDTAIDGRERYYRVRQLP